MFLIIVSTYDFKEMLGSYCKYVHVDFKTLEHRRCVGTIPVVVPVTMGSREDIAPVAIVVAPYFFFTQFVGSTPTHSQYQKYLERQIQLYHFSTLE